MKPVVCGFLLLPLALLFGSCLNDEAADIARCPEAECGPFAYRDSYFPLAVGNVWRFAADSGSGVVDTVVLSVAGENTEVQLPADGLAGAPWDVAVSPAQGVAWFHEAWHSSYRRHGDSVYATQLTHSDGSVSALWYLVPPGDDTVTWSSLYGGDVGIEISAVRLQDPVTVPAGTFSPCIAFEYQAMEAHRTVLCDEVGWVSFELGDRALHLVDYMIVP